MRHPSDCLQADRLQALVDRLKSKGVRITPQRLAIFKALFESGDHPSVEHIHKRLAREFPSMSLATVYKNILLLKREGAILELEFSGLGNRYDALNPRPHPHLICLRCGAIVDPPVPALDSLAQRMAEDTGFKIISHRLDFFGLCPDCEQS